MSHEHEWVSVTDPVNAVNAGWVLIRKKRARQIIPYPCPRKRGWHFTTRESLTYARSEKK